MSYAVRISHRAEKEMERLDRTTLKRIQARIDELARDPLDPRLSAHLIMGERRRYSRVGDWRIVYEIRETEQSIYVATIQPRGRAYRKL